MMKLHQEQLFQLLRQSMGLTEQKDFAATAEDWQWLFQFLRQHHHQRRHRHSQGLYR